VKKLQTFEHHDFDQRAETLIWNHGLHFVEKITLPRHQLVVCTKLFNLQHASIRVRISTSPYDCACLPLMQHNSGVAASYSSQAMSDDKKRCARLPSPAI
jgi:hypothetical protein